MREEEICIQGRDGRNYLLRPLTKSLAKRYVNQLLSVHNIIPYVHWEAGDLLADVSPKGVAYRHKWQLSFTVFDGSDRVVGMLVAYVRDVSDMHPLKSIYIHRLAIATEHQGNWIGRKLLTVALESYSRVLPAVTVYTVQTNDELANATVLNFYQMIGFKRFLPVQYPDKLDVLMKLTQQDLIETPTLGRFSWRGSF